MKTSVHRGLPLLGALLIFQLLVGCSPPPTKKQFNDRIVTANKKLADASMAFRKAVMPLRDGQQVSPPQVQAALNSARSAFQEVKSAYEAPEFPRDSGPAEAFATEYQKFLKVQEEILDIMRIIATTVEDPNTTINVKWAFTAARYQQIKDMETAALESLRKAQQSYAEAHYLSLVQNYEE